MRYAGARYYTLAIQHHFGSKDELILATSSCCAVEMQTLRRLNELTDRWKTVAARWSAKWQRFGREPYMSSGDRRHRAESVLRAPFSEPAVPIPCVPASTLAQGRRHFREDRASISSDARLLSFLLGSFSTAN